MGSDFAINASIYHQNPSGLGVVTREIVKRLVSMADERYLIEVYKPDILDLSSNRAVINTVPKSTSPGKGSSGHAVRYLWENIVLAREMVNKGTGLLYSPVPEGPLWGDFKQVVTVHDLIPMLFPALHPKMKHYFRHYLPRLLKKVDAVICVSSRTRDDLMKHYGLDKTKIHVIPNGYDEKLYRPVNDPALLGRFQLEEYFLFVGDMRPYKNLKLALEAFTLLDRPELKFVLAGRKDPRFLPEIEHLIRALGITEQVLFTGYLKDEEIVALYSHALALVFTSLYEGFGLPALEAMACGCSVLASVGTSLEEVCGQAAIYCDPQDVQSIRDGMADLMESRNRREELRGMGLIRAREFSWSRTAAGVMNVIEGLL